MPITASQLRADVYNLLDRVLETGEQLEVVRNGQILRISGRRRSFLDDLPRRPEVVVGGLGTLAEGTSVAEWEPSALDAP
jgi:hypothetical protein